MRYALYVAPPANDPLTAAAHAWLGRDAFIDEIVPSPVVEDLTVDEWMEITAEPRRYGFHGTLKAPFTLAEARTEKQLLQTLDEFSAECAAFEIPELVLGQLGPFFALVPGSECVALQDFAAQTVRRFEPFRAPLSPDDVARRKPERLSERQRDNLDSFGYPYVFDEFRFHMTLTGPVAPERQAHVRGVLETAFAPFLGRPLHVGGLALFVEPRRGAPFTVHSILPLGGASLRKTA